MPLLPYSPLLCWLIFSTFVSFLGYVAYDLHVIQSLLNQDATHISALILLVFIGMSGYCGYQAWHLSSQLSVLLRFRITHTFDSLSCRRSPSVLESFIQQQASIPLEVEPVLAAEILAEKLKGTNQLVWFFSGIVIKLGLLGTVIGFVIMLLSVSGLDQLDIEDIKDLMQQMTQGMGIAMNTTMVGLVSSILLGLQGLMLDRFADGMTIAMVEEVTAYRKNLAKSGIEHGAV